MIFSPRHNTISTKERTRRTGRCEPVNLTNRACVPERCMSRNDASSTGWMGGCRRAKGLAPRCHFASAMAKRNCTACSFRFPEKFISLTSSKFSIEKAWMRSARAFGERFWHKPRFENAEILCVFQGFQTAGLGQKIRRRPQTHLRCAAHKEKSRPAAATVGRRAAFRKTRTATVFSLTEGPPKRKFFL